jgi:LysR family transcriptional regulator, glycine cleavage system transcriptional activator
MQSLRMRLPPVNSLIAFEAAARHLSITRAAQELTVSREAVSRHIRILEEHLGTDLFLRRHRAIELTEPGRALYASVSKNLGEIARTASEVAHAKGSSRVTVTATIAIASFWLTPRLPAFRDANRDIEIRVRISDTPLDMIEEGIDVGLRYGNGRWPGLKARHLFDTNTFPVCSPAYLAKAGPIEKPGDLLDHPLLNLDGPPHSDEDWAWWLEGEGVALPRSFRTLGFDSYANVIQAAMEGQGIALGFSRIVDHHLARGDLVRPLDAALSKGHGVHVVVPRGVRLGASAQRFYEWVVAQA